MKGIDIDTAGRSRDTPDLESGSIGIDLGTSGTKTVLFDREGHALASATIEYPLYQPQNGYAEQDPDDWWNAAAGTIRMDSSR